MPSYIGRGKAGIGARGFFRVAALIKRAEVGIDHTPFDRVQGRAVEEHHHLGSLIRTLCTIWVEDFHHEVGAADGHVEDLELLGVGGAGFDFAKGHLSGIVVVQVVRATGGIARFMMASHTGYYTVLGVRAL